MTVSAGAAVEVPVEVRVGPGRLVRVALVHGRAQTAAHFLSRIALAAGVDTALVVAAQEHGAIVELAQAFRDARLDAVDDREKGLRQTRECRDATGRENAPRLAHRGHVAPRAERRAEQVRDGLSRQGHLEGECELGPGDRARPACAVVDPLQQRRRIDRPGQPSADPVHTDVGDEPVARGADAARHQVRRVDDPLGAGERARGLLLGDVDREGGASR